MKKILLITALLLAQISAAAAQAGDTLVGGNPPLTRADFESVVEYYERGLGIEFSGAQRGELEQILVKNWRRIQKTNPASLSGWLTTISKINGISGAKREQIRDEIRQAVLGDLRNSSGSELSSFVLGVYEDQGAPPADADRTGENGDSAGNARAANSESGKEERASSGGSVTPYTDEYQPVAGGVSLSELAGKWGKTTVSASGYRNVVTGDYKSGYGFSNQHEIGAGGAFAYYNFATISLYDCTTELFTSMKGRARVSGGEVTFTYASGTVDIKDSCKKTTVTKPAQIRTTTYRLERGKKYLRMCEVGADSPSCIYKAGQE